jgi:hypothetical protein
MGTSESTVIRASLGPDSQAPCASAPHSGKRHTFAAVLLTAARAAVSALPVVGPVIAAAVPNGTGARDAATAAGVAGTSETLQYLELQRAIERESRLYETVSNVMKARHDAAMNSIRNLRS